MSGDISQNWSEFPDILQWAFYFFGVLNAFATVMLAILAYRWSNKNREIDLQISDRVRWQPYNTMLLNNPNLFEAINKLENKNLSDLDNQMQYLMMMKLNNLSILFTSRGRDRSGKEHMTFAQFANETYKSRKFIEEHCFPRFSFEFLKVKLRKYWIDRILLGEPISFDKDGHEKELAKATSRKSHELRGWIDGRNKNSDLASLKTQFR